MDDKKINKPEQADVNDQSFALPKKDFIKSQHDRFNDGDVFENVKVQGERNDASQDNYDDYTDDNRYEQDLRRSPETGKRIKK